MAPDENTPVPEAEEKVNQEKEVEETGPQPYEELLEKAESMLNDYKLSEARDYFTELSVNYPNLGEAWAGLAKLDYIEDDVKGAARNYGKCHKVSPTLGIFHRFYEMSMDHPDKMFEFAKALYQESNYEESLKFTDKLVEMELPPKLRTDTLNLREDLKQLIEKQHEETDDQTFKKGEKGVKFMFQFLGVLVIIGIIAGLYFYTQKIASGAGIQAGIDAYNRAVKKKNDFKMSEKGGLEARASFEKAEKILGEVASKAEKNPKAHYYLAKTYLQRRELEKMIEVSGGVRDIKADYNKLAMQELNKCVEADTNYSPAYVERARLKLNTNDLEGAYSDLKLSSNSMSTFTNEPKERENIAKQIDNVKKSIENKMGKSLPDIEPEEPAPSPAEGEEKTVQPEGEAPPATEGTETP